MSKNLLFLRKLERDNSKCHSNILTLYQATAFHNFLIFTDSFLISIFCYDFQGDGLSDDSLFLR